jgi:hypothetical protein
VVDLFGPYAHENIILPAVTEQEDGPVNINGIEYLECPVADQAAPFDLA